MTNLNIGRWLLVAIAVVGLAVLAPAVSAHGDETTADDAPPNDANATDWAAWMEAQMTEHMGPGSVEWMEAHMGTTVDEMGRFMADGDGTYGPGHGTYGPGAGMYGPGGGC